MILGDGGASTVNTDVVKIQVKDADGQSTWAFNTITADEVKYNSDTNFGAGYAFWTESSANLAYTKVVSAGTNLSLEDNFGNDLLDGIVISRAAGNLTVNLYIGYGINVQGKPSAPANVKVPVTSGKYYKVTYASHTAALRNGWAVTGATVVDGSTLHTFTTANSETAYFIVKATSTTMVLANNGEAYGDKSADTAGNNCMLVSVEEVTPTLSGTITACGWSSFASDVALDLSTITATSGATAYYASNAEGGKVTLTSTNGKVPAGTGLMIKGKAGETFTISAVAASETTDISASNLLKGQTTTGNVAASTGGTYHYVFGFKTADPSEYGFYNLTAATEVAASKAYLETTTAINAARLVLVFDDENVTGIQQAVKSEELKDKSYYNLNGQRVAQPTKGLYIMNGKKVIIK